MTLQIPGGVFKDFEPAAGNACFVIMPFAQEFTAVYDVIKDTVESSGFTCYRADDINTPGDILDDVFKGIWSAEVVIADLSGRSANVFYELGLAHAINDNVVLLTQDVGDLPFDLARFRVLAYDNTMAGAKRLTEQLADVLPQLTQGASSRSGPGAPLLSTPPTLDPSRQQREPADLNADIGADTPLFVLATIGNVATNTGSIDLAEAVLDEVRRRIDVEAEPDEVPVWLSLGILAEVLGHEDLARDVYEKTLSVTPDDPGARETYASFLMDLASPSDEDLALAVKLLEGLPLDSTERTIALRLQYESLSGGDLAAAVDWAIENFIPTDMNARSVLIAMAQLETPHEREARDVVAEWIDANPESVRQAQRALAEFLDMSDDPEVRNEAIEIYRNQAQNPDDTESDEDRSSLSLLLAINLLQRDEEGDPEEAAQLLTEAYASNPFDLNIRGLLAQRMAELGRDDLANRVLRGEPLDD